MGVPMQPDDQKDYEALTRTCFIRGCGRRGYYQAVVLLSPDGERHKPLLLKGWLFCEGHAKVMDIRDLVGGPMDPSWRRIQELFRARGFDVPMLNYTKLAWRDA